MIVRLRQSTGQDEVSRWSPLLVSAPLRSSVVPPSASDVLGPVPSFAVSLSFQTWPLLGH